MIALALAASLGITHLVIVAIGLALLCYLLFWVLGYLGAPEPIRKVITVVVVVLVVLWILSWFLPILGVAL